MRNIIQCALEHFDEINWVQSEQASGIRVADVGIGESIEEIDCCILQGIALAQFFKVGIRTRKDGVGSLSACCVRMLGQRNCDLMEIAFEPFLPEIYEYKDAEAERAYAYCRGKTDARERAKMILTNALLNNGRFKP